MIAFEKMAKMHKCGATTFKVANILHIVLD